MQKKKSILDRRGESKHCNEYTKPGREKKLGEQVNQKLLYRESDWWDVRLVVHKARKQGIQYIKVRFGRILYNYNSPTFANRLLRLQIQDCEL